MPRRHGDYYWVFIKPDLDWKLARWVETTRPNGSREEFHGCFVLSEPRDEIPNEDVVLSRGPLRRPK